MQRFVVAVAIAVFAIACSSGSGAPTAPGAQPTPGGGPTGAPTAPPVVTPGGQPAVTPGGQPAGDLEAKARALMPPGATETGELVLGGMYQLYGSTTTLSIEQLDAFWTQAIPAQGMTLVGKFSASGTLTMSVTNPDGGIVATPDEGAITFVISLGTSS